MTRYSNGFEGQTDGVAATTANSGASGTAFSSTSIGTGTTCTYAAAAAHAGSMGLRFTYTDAALGTVLFAAAPATATTRVAMRAYVFWTDTVSATQRGEGLLALRSATTTVAYLNLTGSGAFQVLDAGGTAVATSTSATTVGTHYRVELAATPGTTTSNGLIEAAVYVGEATSPFWTATVTGNVGTAAVASARIGRNVTGCYARTVNFDEIAVDDALASGFIGPTPPPPPPGGITVTPQPSNSPPRVQLTVTSPDGSAITAASVTRVDPSGGAPTRVQLPLPAASGSVLYDYEAPWDAPLTYSVAITYGSGSTATYTAAAVTLSPAAIWLIHPTAPVLSVCLDQGRFDRMGIVTLGGETRPEIKTKHRIQGSEFQIVTKTGPRGAMSTSLQVATVTAAERASLVAISRDQTPLFLQVPAAWGWDLDGGYYDVGDLGTERFLQYGPEPRRVSTLPLERVEAPIGTQAALWTWTGVAAGFATWDAERAAYATWADVATNTRR